MKLIQNPRRRPKHVIHLARDAAREAIHRTPPALEMVFALFLLILVGTGLLTLPGASTRPLTVLEAAFTSTSASAVTGLSVFTPSTTLTLLGQVILLVLAQIGGSQPDRDGRLDFLCSRTRGQSVQAPGRCQLARSGYTRTDHTDHDFGRWRSCLSSRGLAPHYFISIGVSQGSSPQGRQLFTPSSTRS